MNTLSNLLIIAAIHNRIVWHSFGGGAPGDFDRRRRQLNVGGGGVWRRGSQE